MTMDEYFRKVSFDGPGGAPGGCALAASHHARLRRERARLYIDRLNFELNIIIQMGFLGYFLIVMDFIQWAKSNGVPVGPGRVSGAGSLGGLCAEDHRPRPVGL